MYKYICKTITAFSVLGLLAACSLGQTYPTTIPNLPTEVGQSPSASVAAPTPLPTDVPAPKEVGISWDFGSVDNAEGWTVGNQIADLQVSQGFLSGQSAGNDPYLYSPVFSIDANSFPYIEISLQTVLGGGAQIFFTTSSDSTFDETKTVYIPSKGYGQFYTYAIDMSSNPGWKGTITQLRLDPSDAASPFSLDYLQIMKPVAISWEFGVDGNTEGWTVRNEITNLLVSQGYLSGDSSGDDPGLNSPGFAIEANNFSTIEIRMEAVSGNVAQLFFTTSSDPEITEAKSTPISIIGDSQFHTYYLDLSSNPGWTNTVNMLRFDPLQNPAAFKIDYIRIMKSIP
jgi:hypothetical protein